MAKAKENAMAKEMAKEMASGKVNEMTKEMEGLQAALGSMGTALQECQHRADEEANLREEAEAARDMATQELVTADSEIRELRRTVKQLKAQLENHQGGNDDESAVLRSQLQRVNQQN